VFWLNITSGIVAAGLIVLAAPHWAARLLRN
jgi:hypothetical protein